MHYKSSFNALIMPCNTHYNNCNHITHQFIVTLSIFNLVIITCNKIYCITKHIMDNYNALYHLITLYNALYMKALCKVLPFLFMFLFLPV